MENASKALIIAGAILVSIMIVSLGVLIFNRMGGTAKEMANMDEQEIAAFNSKITPYLGKSITGSQVNVLIQYVISNNLACVQSGETHKAITIRYPGNNTGISVNASGITYGDSGASKRVDTGANKHYIVDGTYDSNGLITTIVVSE